MIHNPFLIAPLFLLLSSLSSVASTTLLDFNSLVHGEEATNQFAAISGVTISGSDDESTAVLPIVAFNTEIPQPDPLTQTTSDPDLQRLGLDGSDSTPGWNGGNLPNDYIVNNALIVQENNAQDGSGIYTDPDDRAAGGTISFTIDSTNFQYTHFQTLLVDFEENGNPTILITDALGNQGSFSPSLVAPENNFLNFTPFLDTATLGLTTNIAQIDFIFNNASGAIGLLYLSDDPNDPMIFVPEPSTILFGGLASLLLLTKRRRS